MKTFAAWCLASIVFAGIAAALAQGGQSNHATGSTGDTPYWSSWRGPLGTGSAVSGRPPTQWAEKSEQGAAKNIAWKVEVPGLGSSSPIVWQDRIYLTTAIETDRPGAAGGDLPPQDHRSLPRPKVIYEFALIALDCGTGMVIWQKKLVEAVPHEGAHSTNSHASSSPVTDGEHIYASFGSRGVYCLNRAGEVIWSKDLGVMHTRRQYGEGSSPALYGDRLIVNWDHEGDSFLVAFDKRSGEELWRQPRDEQTSWSTPIVVEVRGRPQIIITGTTASRGYDLESGEVIWSLSGMTENCIPIPIHAAGVVYLMSGYRGQMLQAVWLEDARGDLEGSRHVLWSHRRNTSYVPSGLLYDGRLYFLRGNNALLSCLDAKTGKVIYEGERLPGLRSIYASPVCADGRIYVTSRAGVTMVIGDGPALKQLAVNRIDEPVDASLAIVGDKIYLRGRRHMYCIAEGPRAKTRPDEGPHEVQEGDVDGDGDLDIAVANRDGPQNYVYLNDGKGEFSKWVPYGTGSDATRGIALADIDGDGHLDILNANIGQPHAVYFGNGSARFDRSMAFGDDSQSYALAPADVNGDGRLDIVVANVRGPNAIYVQRSDRTFRKIPFGAPDGVTYGLVVADLNGDGRPEIATANSDGHNYLYQWDRR